MFDWIGGLFTSMFDWVSSLLPNWLGGGYSDLAAVFGPTAQYFAYLSGLDVIAPLILGAYVIRFTIRRIPVVG